MSKKDKVLFNKITKDDEHNILFDNNIIKIILDNRKHKLVNCYGNTYRIISIEDKDMDK